jgi:glycosyltransferase involved in cell wall biosynthesis
MQIRPNPILRPAPGDMFRRVAIVHDWLTMPGGAERVLEQMLALFPKADLYAIVDFLPQEDRGWLGGRPVRTSFLQRMPFARKHYRYFLPLMPLAVEQWDFSGYDLVVSSCDAVVKGLIAGPDQVHVSYVHTPMRYAWDLQDSYLRQTGLGGVKGWAARWFLHKIRLWDQAASQRVDHFVANSAFVAKRIAKTYRREASVVPPPVATERFQLSTRSEDFFLVVSRLVPYKRVDLIAEAFAAMPDHKLVIIGDGPERERVLAHQAPNITYLGRQSDAVVDDYMARCRAFISAAVEDFGIAPLEAQACGKPVIALHRGGAVETLYGLDAHTPTAVFFDSQDADALCKAVNEFDRVGDKIRPQDCRDNALRYAPEHFRRRFLDEVLAAAGQNVGGAQAVHSAR